MAVLDAGYNEFVTMPLELVADLGPVLVGSCHEVFDEPVPYKSDS